MKEPLARARRASRSVPSPHGKTVRCVGRTASGEPCRAATVRGTNRCLFHTRDKAAQAGREGGRPRAQYDTSKLKKFAPPESAADMRKLLATMVIEMRSGLIDVELATKVSYVASVFLKSAEQEDMKFVKAELEELKRRFGSTPERGRR